MLHWVNVVARTNIELAFQFAAAAPEALSILDVSDAEAWIIQALDVYDREGLHRGTQVLKNRARFSADEARTSALKFEDVAHVLQIFVHGLSGRPVRLDTAAQGYTDTDVLYLPSRISRGDTAQENFFLYKTIAVLLWAQNRYGTFKADLQQACAGFPDRQRALGLLDALETVRLESRIAQVLPGLACGMAALRGTVPLDPRCARLLEPSATVEDSIALLRLLYDAPPALEHPYDIVLHPLEAAAARSARIAREKLEFQNALSRMLQQEGVDPAGDEASRYGLEIVETGGAATDAANASYTLHVDRKPLTLSPDMGRLIESILQDLGDIPDEYLVPAGGAQGDDGEAAPDAAIGAAPREREEAPIFFYDEWDHQRRQYRKNWCVLRELEVQAGDAGFVSATLIKYAAKIGQLKRTFELMREEERLLKRQAEGDGIDLDAVVEAYADMRTDGAELASLLFTKRRKHERDLAVMLMVDMSGSTKGWINEAEREALVMLCEALEVLGDRYAIYGFSGMTRKRCEIFRIKRFDEAYGQAVHERIAGIEPQDYTRMGAAIRHLATLLNRVQARTKLLITLSDGKPDDYSDEYRGEYGIEDTRHALLEAHRAGIRPFCITIDTEAREYLPHMYGPVNWTLVDDAALLPVKIASIYQRLTS